MKFGFDVDASGVSRAFAAEFRRMADALDPPPAGDPQAALRAAHHELTCLQGLQVIDGAAAGHSFAVEVSATLALIDAALVPNATPGDPR